MRSRAGYTFEPYERVPDDQTVMSPPTRNLLAWRLSYIGVAILLTLLLVIGIAR